MARLFADENFPLPAVEIWSAVIGLRGNGRTLNAEKDPCELKDSF
jgi:hypothetical protein